MTPDAPSLVSATSSCVTSCGSAVEEKAFPGLKIHTSVWVRELHWQAACGGCFNAPSTRCQMTTRSLLAGVSTPQRAVNWLRGSVGVEHDLMPLSAARLVEKNFVAVVCVKQRDWASDKKQWPRLGHRACQIDFSNSSAVGKLCLCGLHVFSTGFPVSSYSQTRAH